MVDTKESKPKLLIVSLVIFLSKCIENVMFDMPLEIPLVF